MLDDIDDDKPLDFAAKDKHVIITQASAVEDAEKMLKQPGPGL